MQVLGADISDLVFDYLNNKDFVGKEYSYINKEIERVCGCKSFFPSQDQYLLFKEELERTEKFCFSDYRAEYGDFQTNMALAEQVTKHLSAKGVKPEAVVEPTCGKGNFILAALRYFPTIKQIIGIEIYSQYVWQCKINILDYFLSNPQANKPAIQIIRANVFEIDFNMLKKQISNSNILVLGNPPWVTNSMLGALDSTNLPQKTNFKKQKGLDAITGKGNFDIAEYIIISLIKSFETSDGCLSFLVKNSVIKNIIYEQCKNRFHISDLEELNIDCKKEFNVSVDASLFFCTFNSQPALHCQVYDFYNGNALKKFGWVKGGFYSDIQADDSLENIDGKSSMVWRQGIKHDCSNVMEMEREGGLFRNKLNESFELEEDLVFGLLKSSDLKAQVVNNSKKYTIVTQRYVGQKTDHLVNYPKTYKYLQKHIDEFRKRKSTIYQGNPDFSIFGIGDYSFKPYKVAISGLYKTMHFTLIMPQEKPLMVDDTCYFLSFDSLKDAVAVHTLLNTEITRSFLKSITFPDAKRMITKEALMRVDLAKALEFSNRSQLIKEANAVFSTINDKASIKAEDFDFIDKKDVQLELF